MNYSTYIEDTIFIARFKEKPNSKTYMENFIDGYDKIIMYQGNNERAWLKFNGNKILNKYIEVDFVIK